ncbi:NADH dehydrogenase subunit G [Motilibacter rhizosphaerae]|uniref:NADH-quinone oxidoreductase n=1 Tax=Motilibacter rhizosphaerae TaxID=598652 RepID=A0A4Q7NA17_9ACTN|nr:NADH-quinone oxidoreductase subunit G [Motilibacter rhizosphaerae]RZS79015.1 NADH dehydrogenase subunit G [Motilibacter rhizosphaerae]
MTLLSSGGAASGAEVQPSVEMVNLTIDGFPVSVPKGTLVIRAAELLGIAIPRFCDHPLLDPVGACRQCLVDVKDAGNGRGMPKPAASCTTTVAEGMVIETQLSSPVADKAQKGVMELLLINHPLDCPVCDKGGECPLQNQAMSNGRSESRFEGVKRTYPKPVPISAQVLLDRERCVLCARCTRFSKQVAGDPFIELLERGALQQVGIYEKQPFESYFSGNTVQICPVGALTGTQYRFRARPFDLVSTPTACEHCASGCAQRTDSRRGKVLRRMAGDDPEVNEEWNCDKGRWAFQYSFLPDRLRTPLVRDSSGALVPTSWPDALDVAARGLLAARSAGGVGVLPGGRLTVEDAYAYAKFARVVLGTDDIDFRARPHSAEEAQFLASTVAGTSPATGGVTYADLERARAVLLVGLEPEEESPILFLRLRKAVRKAGLQVLSVAPFATRGLTKLSGTLVPAAPGTEAEVLDALAEGGELGTTGTVLTQSGAVLLVGERLATSRGALSAVARLAARTGARVAWVPRRAGERGALEAGALPGLLPGGRPVTDAEARIDVATAWGAEGLPTTPGRDLAGILAAAVSGQLGGLVVGGVDPADLPDPAIARAALKAVPFLVSLEQRPSAVTELADVVLPVAADIEREGSYLDWEGRVRPFRAVLANPQLAQPMLPDGRVLHVLAEEMGADLGLPHTAAARHELDELGRWEGGRATAPDAPVPGPPVPAHGQAVLATWHQLLDGGRLQEGEPFLAATAPAPVARVSPATAEEVGVVEGGTLTVATAYGMVTLPVVLTEMPDRVVWLPTRSTGSEVRRTLRAGAGDLVSLAAGPAAVPVLPEVLVEPAGGSTPQGGREGVSVVLEPDGPAEPAALFTAADTVQDGAAAPQEGE